MEKQQELSSKFDQAELLTTENKELNIKVENWQVEDISSSDLTRSSLRVIEKGSLGSNTSFGQSDKSWHKLLTGAGKSAQYGDEAVFSFSQHSLNSYHEREEKNFHASRPEDIIFFIEKLLDFFRASASDLTLNVSLSKTYEKITLQTSRSARLRENKTNYRLVVSVPIPGGGSQFARYFEQSEMFGTIPEVELNQFLREFSAASEVSCPQTGNLPVIFTPRSLYFFMVAFKEGISAANIYQEISPLQDRRERKIFSENISVIDQPHMEAAHNRRYFDDEGIPTREQKLVEEGVLQKYLYDLEYASRLDAKPLGNGLKRSLFSSGIEVPVNPSPVNPVIEPGSSRKEDLIADLQEGIMVENIVGFHSSNYSQGHFSVQAHGYHIKEGELQGRLEDVMISGNIYDDFKQVEGVGRKLYPGYFGYYPYLLVPDIQISGR